MFENYRPLVPSTFRDDVIYANPPKEVWLQYKGEKDAKKERKKELKLKCTQLVKHSKK